MKIVVLGRSGMLGSMVVQQLAHHGGDDLILTERPGCQLAVPGPWQCRPLDAENTDLAELQCLLDGADWAINCIGLIKHHIQDGNSADVVRATKVNALFPHLLADAAGRVGCRVIQIATDCVYSGAKGGYVESDLHDALDVYGKTKSVGEPPHAHVHNLRCSIIGPEFNGKRSLLEWFLGQARDAQVTGFANHRWNGVTTFQFARICSGISHSGMALPNALHVVPGDALSKAELLSVFADAFHRNDIVIDQREVPEAIDRTLSTLQPGLNHQIWEAAGYGTPPTLAEMVQELSAAMGQGLWRKS